VVGGDCDGQHSMVGMNAAPRKAYRMSDTGVYQQAPPAELEACRVVHEQAELACGGTENGAGTPTSPFPNKPFQAIGMSDRDTAGQYPSSPNMFFTPRLSPRGRASPLGARYMDSPLGHDVPAASDMPQGAAVAEFGADLPMESEQQHSASAQPSTEMGAHAPRNTEQDWTVSSLYSSAAALDPSDIPTKSALKICQLSTHLPLSMARSSWYLQDFLILSNAETRNKLKVYHALCVHSQLQVDLKAYHKDRMSASELKMLQQRAVVLSRLCHPHVVRFYGAFEDVHNIYFLHERSVPAQINKLGALQETECLSVWLLPLLTAFDYLVSHGIRLGLPCLHNLVFTNDHTVKYSEFITAWDERTPSMCEVDWWAALAPPERCGRLPPGVPRTQNFEERTLSWAMGTLAFRLLTGTLPSKPTLNACDEALAGDALYDGLPDSLSGALSSDAILFLGAALNLNPRERTKVKDLLTHSFVTMGSGVVDSALNEPSRLSVDSGTSSFAVPRGPSVDSFAVPRGPSADAYACDPTRPSLAERFRGSQDVSGFESERCSLSSNPKSSLDARNSSSRHSRLAHGVHPASATIREGVPVVVLSDALRQLPHASTSRTKQEGGAAPVPSNSSLMEGAGMFLPSKGGGGSQPSRDSGRDEMRRRIGNAIQSQPWPLVPSAVDKMVQHAVMLEQQ